MAAVITAATLAPGRPAGSSKPEERRRHLHPAPEATTEAPDADPDRLSHSLVPWPRCPGYRPGEIPPIPLFSLPAIDVFASNADKAVIDSASSQLASVEGVTVSPAKCDGSSLISGSTVYGGDGSAVSSSAGSTVVNGGDGSGVLPEAGGDALSGKIDPADRPLRAEFQKLRQIRPAAASYIEHPGVWLRRHMRPTPLRQRSVPTIHSPQHDPSG